MGYYQDLRAFLRALEKRGEMVRWDSPIDKDSELMPVYRLQFRGLDEGAWKAFSYEQVVNAKGRRYDMPVVAGCYGASEDIFALGMGCNGPDEIYEKWHQAISHPIDPVIVKSGPVHEEVHLGSEIQELGLDELPAPVEEPGFSGSIRTSTPWITKDPETGVRNMGCYSGHFRARDRIQCGINPVSHTLLYHWRSAQRAGKSLPAVIVVGVTPNLIISACTKVPYGVDELAVAGGIAGEPVELVKCKTVPLEVPANAEIVIEGEISTDIQEPYAAFGEYPGYMMGESWSTPVMKVTAICHRKNAIFTPIVVGLPPGDSNIISRFCQGMVMHEFLKHGCKLPVLDTYYHRMGASHNFLVIRIKKTYPSQPWEVLHAAASVNPACKWLIVVDEDINAKDLEMVTWALSYSMQPREDMQIISHRVGRLDPSAALPSRPGDPQESFPGILGASAVMIDATRKRPFPPVGFPRKEYMERAQDLWKSKGLPQLKLRSPWYGYELGRWTADDDENAQLLTKGEYLKVGEKMKKRQTQVFENQGTRPKR